MVKRFSTKTIMKKHIVNEDPREGKIIIVIQDILFHFFHGFVQDVPAQIWWTPTSAYKIAPEPSCNSGGWLEHRVTGFYLWSNIRECLKIVDPHNTLHTIHCRKPMHFETQILGRKFFDQVVTRVQVSLISKDASYNCICLKRNRLPTISKKKHNRISARNQKHIGDLYSLQFSIWCFHFPFGCFEFLPVFMLGFWPSGKSSMVTSIEIPWRKTSAHSTSAARRFRLHASWSSAWVS